MIAPPTLILAAKDTIRARGDCFAHLADDHIAYRRRCRGLLNASSLTVEAWGVMQ
jgi:hypothetical protein